jgi:nanoRNase/pAp phosphatase (c-di-AMP/oligoRNAs hydrolase)
MLQVVGVQVAIVFKRYDSGKYTAAIRSGTQAPVAAQLAEFMGGGGHPHASGFKIEQCKSFDDAQAKCLSRATELVSELAVNAA